MVEGSKGTGPGEYLDGSTKGDFDESFLEDDNSGTVFEAGMDRWADISVPKAFVGWDVECGTRVRGVVVLPNAGTGACRDGAGG